MSYMPTIYVLVTSLLLWENAMTNEVDRRKRLFGFMVPEGSASHGEEGWKQAWLRVPIFHHKHKTERAN